MQTISSVADFAVQCSSCRLYTLLCFGCPSSHLSFISARMFVDDESGDSDNEGEKSRRVQHAIGIRDSVSVFLSLLLCCRRNIGSKTRLPLRKKYRKLTLSPLSVLSL